MSELNDPRVLFAAAPEAFGSTDNLTLLDFIALGIFAVFFSSRQYMTVLGSVNPAEFPTGYSAKFALVVQLWRLVEIVRINWMQRRQTREDDALINTYPGAVFSIRITAEQIFPARKDGALYK